MPKVRDCQADFIADIKASLKKHKRIIGCASTGFGKSVVLASIVKMCLEKRRQSLVVNRRKYAVVIVLPRRSLVKQLSASFVKYNIVHGVVMSQERMNLHAEIQIVSIDTYMARVDSGRMEFLDADILLIDECHMQMTDKKLDLFRKYPVAIGVTATPVGPAKKALNVFYEDIVEAIDMKDLIEQGFLVPIKYYAPTIFHAENVRLGSDGDYNEKALSNYVDQQLKGDDGKRILVGDIYDNWEVIARDRKTVIFCASQAHARYVTDEFRGKGINAEYIDCNTPDDERERIFQGVEFGDIQVICNVSIVGVGISIDNISCVVFASPTKLLHKYLQGVGRGTRTYANKEDLVVIDHCGIVLALGFAEEKQYWSLDGKETPEQRQQKAKEETKQPKEIKCVKCSAIFKSRRVCPACGYEMVAQGQPVPTHQAEMKQIEKTAKVKPADKAAWFAQLLYIARSKGYQDGWAANKFRAKFQEWPHRKAGVQPIPPTPEVLGFMQHLAIKNARSGAGA